MEIIICPDADSASLSAADQVASLLHSKPTAVLGLATGGTPLALYSEIIRKYQKHQINFSQASSFNLDEYIGLAPGHPASYQSFMQENLFRHINMPAESVHIPDGLAVDVPSHCLAYENSIREAGGIDLQILGIGTDGHIGFNEPTSSLASRTRIKTLTERTRSDNARFFHSMEEVPHHVITMGIGTIMESRAISLLAFGESKARAVADMVEGPITSSVPASILQMHPTVRVFLDEPAAALLSRRDYYRHVFARKPSWQKW